MEQAHNVDEYVKDVKMDKLSYVPIIRRNQDLSITTTIGHNKYFHVNRNSSISLLISNITDKSVKTPTAIHVQRFTLVFRNQTFS